MAATLSPPSSLEPLAAAVCGAAALPLEQAVALPAAAYFDPSLYAWELEHLFRRRWVCVAHASQLPRPGDYMNVDLAGEPMVVVRGKDGVLRVLSRACMHRGMDIMPAGFGRPPRGNTRVLLCPYHYWGYELDGKLKGAPEMHKARDFDRDCVGLHEHRSATWEGFVFVNLTGDAPPLEPQLEELRAKFLHRWELGTAVVVWEKLWPSPFNWKVLVENFMEAYHHLGSHAKTLQPVLPAQGCFAEPSHDAYAAVHLPIRADLLSQSDGGRGLTALRPFAGMAAEDFREWWVFLAYPNHLLFTAPDRVYWYRFLPTGPESGELLTTMLVDPAALAEPGFEHACAREAQLLVDVHTEDVEACTGVQRGLRAAGYRPGRLSHLEEPVWQIQRWLAARLREAGLGR